MDMRGVVIELNAIKEVFLGIGIHGERHVRMQLWGPNGLVEELY